MSSALDDVPGGVVSLDADLRITAANRALGTLVGRDPSSLIGEPFDVLLSLPARILFQTHVFPALQADGRIEEAFLTLATAEPEPTPVLVNAVRTDSDGLSHYDLLIVRIRARSRWEADLLHATQALHAERAAAQRVVDELAATTRDLEDRHDEERRNRAFRDVFVGVVSHELRTPITTIFGMSQLLKTRLSSLDPAVVAQHLSDIADEADRMRRLTEDLLVLSRAEGRQLRVGSEPILVPHLVRRAVDAEAERSPGHRFSVEVGAGQPAALGEDTYVDQVVRNLLSNAAKYSPSGTTIRITIGREDDGVAVRVIDEGPGFGDQAPDALFEVFYRAPGVVGTTSGAGIGLFVCRELVAAMGGRIWASAAPLPATHGAEFGFWLPDANDDDPEADGGS
ncbi:MAG: PAS domain-containing protein [Chloroflexi bacterium]|nr:PAS domain-containing protein [Chloroflexota bacterium]